MKNNGINSQKLFEKHWEILGKEAFLERLTDTRDIQGKLRAKGIIGFGFATANPSDYILTHKSVMSYVEIKSTQNMTSFPFDFTPAQWGGMKKQLAAGGIYTVYVHQTIFDKWYKVPAAQILEQYGLGLKSIKWELLEEWTIQCRQKRNTLI